MVSKTNSTVCWAIFLLVWCQYCCQSVTSASIKVNVLNPIAKSNSEAIFYLETTPAADAIEIKKVQTTDLEEPIPLAKSGASQFILDLSSHEAQGLYRVVLSVTPPNKSSAVTRAVWISVLQKATLSETKLMGNPVKVGDKMTETSFDAANASVFTFSFKVLAQKMPNQAMLRFHHHDSGKNFYQNVFYENGDTTFHYRSRIEIASAASWLNHLSGKYTIQAIISDPSYAKQFKWKLGTVDISLPAKLPMIPKPLYTEPLLHESDTTLAALPEIKHMMRTPDSRPNALVSLIFTMLVIAPFGWYVKFVSSNLHLSAPAFKNLWFSAFIMVIGAILSLFVMFWVKLTMFTTLNYLGVLAVCAMFFGHKALKATTTDLLKK